MSTLLATHLDPSPDAAPVLAVPRAYEPGRDRCVVCGDDRAVCVVGRDELAADLDWLREFHARRLRSGATDEELADRATFTQDDPADVVACHGCGLIYRRPRPSAADLARAYRRDHYGRERLDALFAAQLETDSSAAERLAARLPRGARVIEIGSFVGAFLAAARARGLAACGIDPGREVTSYCRDRHLPVYEGTTEDLAPEPGSVECVVIRNTFDQLPDPSPVLAWTVKALVRGGLVTLRVPSGAFFARAEGALRRLAAGRARALRRLLAWNNLLGFPYLHGYSLPTLDALAARFGLVRIAARGDTLAVLSDGATRPWARAEERALKGALRALLATARTPLVCAPWLEVDYRRV